jgi:hypothetical protein
VKPLASPIVEYRLMGSIQIALGVALTVVAVVVDGPAAAIVVLFEAALFGTLMYVLCYRRFARRVVADPRPAPVEAREDSGATTRRVGLINAALGLSFLVIAVATVPSVVAGISVGNGAACLRVCRLWRRWEQEHGQALLREPRWRFSAAGRRGWGRGRGMLDPQDYYAGEPVHQQSL